MLSTPKSTLERIEAESTHRPPSPAPVIDEEKRLEEKRLNVAMVVASPFPANHGTPGSIREMAEAIAGKGHRIHIVTYHFGEEIPVKNVPVHRIPPLGFRKKVVVGPTREKPILDLLMVFKLIQVILREKIDLIHAHNYEGALVGYLAKIATGRPMIYHAVCTMADELPAYDFFKSKRIAVRLAGLLDGWVPRMADRIIPISSELADFLSSKGIEPGKIDLIPLGIDCSRFDASDRLLTREKHHLGESPTVIYTGTLDRFQRIDYLLKAMKNVVAKIPEARLLLLVNIAKEVDLKECHTMIDDLGLRGQVDIVIHRSFEEVPHFLAAADVVVAPRPECPGFPVKLLNYAAAGKPIVVFGGSAKGLQHLKQAIVVNDHDWQAMGDGIITLLQSPVLAESLGQNAREWVEENLAWPKIVERIEKVYRRCLEVCRC